jgi:hypothetical protein
MRKERVLLETYVPPMISIEEVKLEGGIASGSIDVHPGTEQGVIVIDEWTDGGNEGSTLGDSRW